MKKGFTMIELIFVIVILGILASVAIPRLAATRTDAEISAAVANIRTFLSDVASYYAVNGEFARDFSVMTNVKFKSLNNSNGGSYGILESGKADTDKDLDSCLQIGVAEDDKGRGIVFFLPVLQNNNTVCKAVLKSAPMQQFLKSTVSTNITGWNGTRSCTGYNENETVENVSGMGCIEISSGGIY